MRQAYTCHGIVTETEVLTEHAVLVDAGRIEAVLPLQQLPHDVPCTQLPGTYLTAGFVDIHVHGAQGRSYNEGSADAAAVIGQALREAGVTTALPTLASDHLEALIGCLEPALGASGYAPRTPGAHFEGPCFSPHQTGAQDPRRLAVPAALLGSGQAGLLLEAASSIRLVALAPELDGAVELTESLVQAGVVVAAGHTNGTAADLARARRAGLSHVTHVYSSQSTTTRRGPWRVPGMLEATLASDDLTVEMIADARHLPTELMVIAHRCLGSRLLAVSDATAGAGLARGSRYQMADVTYEVGDGVGLTLDGTSFGGSTTLLGHMLPVLTGELGLTLVEAVAMLTSRPADAARLDDVGRLAPGALADLTLLSDSLVPLDTAVGGHWHHARKEH